MYNISAEKPENRRVAIYARVSTEHEAQLSALENQKDWYKPILEQNPNWQLVESYIDEGITGTSAEKRPRFMKMIADAEHGDFDLILTREVSRFARNTVDTLEYTRNLKKAGVEVFFLNDNIRTFDGDGELRLTIMATLAQDESRKTSIRVKSGQRTSMEKGTLYGNGNILGYDRVGKDLVINPEQAKTVRLIYDLYLDGMGLRQIHWELEKRKIPTATGNTKWHDATIGRVLKNPFYCGIIVYGKQYVPDYLEQKKINNYGEKEQLTIRGTHETIVTEEEFNRVQAILRSNCQSVNNNQSGKHKQSAGQRKPINVWTKLLICECGTHFNRHTWHKYEWGTQYAYQCYNTIRNGSHKTREKKGLPTEGFCNVPMVPEWKLQMMAKYIFQNFLGNKEEVISLAMSILEPHIDDEAEKNDNSALIEQKQNEIDKLTKRLNNLIEMRADGEITRDIFKSKQTEIEIKVTALRTEIAELKGADTVEEDETTHEEKITILRHCLERMTTLKEDEDVPEDVIEAFVKKIVVHENSFDWYLRFSPDDKTFINTTVEGNLRNKNKPPFVKCCTGSNQESQININ